MNSSNFDKMSLTKEQDDCVNFDSGDLLIRGVAGAGKSVVLLKRAIRINQKAKQNNSGTNEVGLFTFANSLVNYTDEILSAKLNRNRRILVSTVDRYAASLYASLAKKQFSIVKDFQRNNIIYSVLQQGMKEKDRNHRFFSLDNDFWRDEFLWIKGCNIRTESEYIQSDRTGRGGRIRMRGEDKKLAFYLFENYQKKLQKANVMDWEDLFIYVVDNAERIPDSKKFNHVLIDEAQDLSVIKLIFLRKLAKDSVTIAADHAQKIYNTTFAWKDIGINVLGRSSKRLTRSFRSTKQIISLANSIIKDNENERSNSEYTEAVLPEINGPKPQLIWCHNEESRKNRLLTYLYTVVYKRKGITCGVLYRTQKEGIIYENWLKETGIPFQVVKQDNCRLLTPGVKLSTMHSAKGLEFDVVIIPKAEDSIYPGDQIQACDEDAKGDLLMMERSLFYVGMTRARNALILMYSGILTRFIKSVDENLYEYYEI